MEAKAYAVAAEGSKLEPCTIERRAPGPEEVLVELLYCGICHTDLVIANNEHGAATLSAIWSDPDFDPAAPAFYYVRVLEIPTPRHSTLDAVALGIPAESTGHPVSIQERAYSSPIHYRP